MPDNTKSMHASITRQGVCCRCALVRTRPLNFFVLTTAICKESKGDADSLLPGADGELERVPPSATTTTVTHSSCPSAVMLANWSSTGRSCWPVPSNAGSEEAFKGRKEKSKEKKRRCKKYCMSSMNVHTR